MVKYIDADELKEHLQCVWDFDDSERIITESDIDNVPAADVAEVVHGFWIDPHWENSNFCCDCSVCKGEAMHKEFRWKDKGIYPICPNCGARMDGEKHD